jgi:hypothetical protein
MQATEQQEVLAWAALGLTSALAGYILAEREGDVPPRRVDNLREMREAFLDVYIAAGVSSQGYHIVRPTEGRPYLKRGLVVFAGDDSWRRGEPTTVTAASSYDWLEFLQRLPWAEGVFNRR